MAIDSLGSTGPLFFGVGANPPPSSDPSIQELKKKEMLQWEYARSALKTGLQLERKLRDLVEVAQSNDQLADKVQGYLGVMLGARGLHVRCIQVDDAPIVGAAIAGLTAFQAK